MSEKWVTSDSIMKAISFLEGIKDINLIKLKLSSMKLEFLSQKQEKVKE